MATTSVRLPDDVLKELDAVARRSHADRSTVLRRAVDRGLHQILLDEALEEYQAGRMTAWGAAHHAQTTLWHFLDALRARDLGLRTDEEHLARQIEGVG